jgi:hypothetical protein
LARTTHVPWTLRPAIPPVVKIKGNPSFCISNISMVHAPLLVATEMQGFICLVSGGLQGVSSKTPHAINGLGGKMLQIERKLGGIR